MLERRRRRVIHRAGRRRSRLAVEPRRSQARPGTTPRPGRSPTQYLGVRTRYVVELDGGGSRRRRGRTCTPQPDRRRPGQRVRLAWPPDQAATIRSEPQLTTHAPTQGQGEGIVGGTQTAQHHGARDVAGARSRPGAVTADGGATVGGSRRRRAAAAAPAQPCRRAAAGAHVDRQGRGQAQHHRLGGLRRPAADWVKPFEQQTGCQVNVKYAGTSDEMVR